MSEPEYAVTGLAEIAQAVDPEGQQRGPVRQAVSQEVGGGGGDQDLAAVGQAPEPGAADDAGADVVPLVPDLTEVQISQGDYEAASSLVTRSLAWQCRSAFCRAEWVQSRWATIALARGDFAEAHRQLGP